MVRAKGHFSLARPILLDDPTHCAQLAAVFAAMRCPLSEKAQAAVRVRLDSTLDTFDYPLEGFPSEGYRLRISPQSIDITAATPVGVIRAAQTLHQLAQGNATPRLECLTITDFPAFKVRGFMHDVGALLSRSTTFADKSTSCRASKSTSFIGTSRKTKRGALRSKPFRN